MALPMLVNGADCGPLNPLQGLSKQFDRDRGIQQDHFGPGRAGSSKEAFRTQYAAAPGVDQDAARFFSANQSPAPFVAGPSTYDLSALQSALPSPQTQLPLQSPSYQASVAPWAADFLQKQPSHPQITHNASLQSDMQLDRERNIHASQPTGSFSQPPQGMLQWAPSPMGLNRLSPMPFQSFAADQTHQAIPHADASLWDREFQSQEASLSTALDENQTQDPQPVQEASNIHVHDEDELARTAGLLIDSVRNEQNPKFQNSQFLGLMKQLRDREVVVEGTDLVQRDAASELGSSSVGGWASEFQTSVDVKGKGRAVNVSLQPSMSSNVPAAAPQATTWASIAREQLSNTAGQHCVEEDPVDAYFRQENEEYINYWKEDQQPSLVDSVQGAGTSNFGLSQQAEWDKLQRDWDSFEATAAGLKPISNYQFQASNPYLLGEASSRTRHHIMHSEGHNSLHDSVLEIEAAVQRDPTNARAWFELGVRQQENEREQKAIHALRRALELDSTHLPSWIALAVSHTNEGNRQGTYQAIREWVDQNDRYRAAVEGYKLSRPEAEGVTQPEQFNYLSQCLIAMARSDVSGEIDPDIQIALAVLLNTNEEYGKAQDCFATALAVRPDDWLLYNRVGATLANSGHPEDALQYYYRALELNPAYIRARFNLGISCINLRKYEEAAQHILDALVLQDSDSVQSGSGPDDKRGVTSSALWDSLKTCSLHMQRLDLATLCDQQELDAFRVNFNMQ